MSSKVSILQRIIAGAADRLAEHPSIPLASRDAFRQTVIVVFERQVVDLFGGDVVRLRGWKFAPSVREAERAARDARIRTALAAGQPHREIAARERCSVRHVERVARAVRQTTRHAPP